MDQVQTTEQPAQPAVKEETTTQPADQSQPVTQEETKADFKSLIPDELSLIHISEPTRPY